MAPQSVTCPDVGGAVTTGAGPDERLEEGWLDRPGLKTVGLKMKPQNIPPKQVHDLDVGRGDRI